VIILHGLLKFVQAITQTKITWRMMLEYPEADKKRSHMQVDDGKIKVRGRHCRKDGPMSALVDANLAYPIG
jgi:hypothetical protein